MVWDFGVSILFGWFWGSFCEFSKGESQDTSHFATGGWWKFEQKKSCGTIGMDVVVGPRKNQKNPETWGIHRNFLCNRDKALLRHDEVIESSW